MKIVASPGINAKKTALSNERVRQVFIEAFKNILAGQTKAIDVIFPFTDELSQQDTSRYDQEVIITIHTLRHLELKISANPPHEEATIQKSSRLLLNLLTRE